MVKPRFSISLKGIETAFSSNEARADINAFGHKQLRIVTNAANILLRTDPLERDSVDPGSFDKFIRHSMRILVSTQQITRNGYRANTEDRNLHLESTNGSNSKYGLQNSSHIEPQYGRYTINNIWNNATIQFVSALSVHKPLLLQGKDIRNLVSQIRPATVTASDMVALLGAIHKAGASHQDEFASVAETCYKNIASKSQIIKHMSTRERSLVLWRRVATTYMSGNIDYTQLKQIRTFIYYCYKGLEDEALFVNGSNEGQASIHPPPESSRDQSGLKGHNREAISHSIPTLEAGTRHLNQQKTITECTNSIGPINNNTKSYTRLCQTMDNIYQASIIMAQCCTGAFGSPLITALGYSTILRLNQMVELAERIRPPRDDRHLSSDTHTKVALAIRDAGFTEFHCIHEHQVGQSTYYLDIVMKKH
ncbi:uncharacterized protein BBOV_IV011970 [Babesia bovis T2Bo]|uniref:Uncharacterized protein n=1 Tax=Babesia bovis TaxID=5865 RepID=A7ASN0_BABBO|nr:uncharacterized protein BBOV_IV011970 [Babesia bovis T2Bo]EDO07549.1 hypothetical protein BBOV_IV011970 [Babesia bovis T2Bo]|eukprot:XP_001611117.1 hypothetical protein [Babesia bovis T2Bo]